MRGVASGGSEGASEKAVVVFFSVEDLSSRFTFGGLLFFLLAWKRLRRIGKPGLACQTSTASGLFDT